jgi:general secretion pathway protein K
MTARRGFVLLAVLWFITGVATIGLGAALTGRAAATAAFNRMALTRAAWAAEACLAAALAAGDLAMRADRTRPAWRTGAWNSLDSAVLADPLVRECPGVVALQPTGVALDVNAAGVEPLRRILSAQGLPSLRTEAMVAALLDWRDRDVTARDLGAEADWYASRGRAIPRNGALASVAELERVRGFEDWSTEQVAGRALTPLDSLFTVERGRIVPSRAPSAVLAALPAGAAESGVVLSAELPELVVDEPEAWILTAAGTGSHAANGTPRLVARIEVRLLRGGRSVAIARHRVDP